MSRMLLAALAGILVLTGISAAMAQPLSVTPRVADDAMAVEFVIANPDPITYRCEIVAVDVSYFTGPMSPPVTGQIAQVADILVSAKQDGQVFRQSTEQLKPLLDAFPQIKRVDQLGSVYQICVKQAEVFRGALVLDDHSSCGDARVFAKPFRIDTGTGQLVRLSTPSIWRHGNARVIASPALPIIYVLDQSQSQPEVLAYGIGDGGLAPAGSLALPAPSVGDTTHHPPVEPGAIGWTMLDSQAMVVAYAPRLRSDKPGAATLTVDLVTLDPGSGAPLSVQRQDFTVPMISGSPDLLVARTLDGTVSMFVSAPIPVAPNQIYVEDLFSTEPIDKFKDPHGTLTQVNGTAVRLDARQQDGGWKLTLHKPSEPSISSGLGDLQNLSESFGAITTLGARLSPEASAQARLGKLGLTRAAGNGLQDLKLLVLQDDGSTISSDAEAGYCEARILTVAPATSSGGQADVNATDDVGRTLLHYAAQRGDADALNRLIARGGIVSAPDAAGKTPAMFAVEGNHGAALAALLQAGAKPVGQVPSLSGPPVSFSMFVIRAACDTCLAPLTDAGYPLTTIDTPGGPSPAAPQICSQLMFARAVVARAYLPDVLIATLPQAEQDRIRAEQAAYEARDTKEDRLERMATALSLPCALP